MTHLEPLYSQNIPKMSEALFQPIRARARRVRHIPAPRLERRVLGRPGRLGRAECVEGDAVPCQVDRFQRVRCVDKNWAGFASEGTIQSIR